MLHTASPVTSNSLIGRCEDAHFPQDPEQLLCAHREEYRKDSIKLKTSHTKIQATLRHMSQRLNCMSARVSDVKQRISDLEGQTKGSDDQLEGHEHVMIDLLGKVENLEKRMCRNDLKVLGDDPYSFIAQPILASSF
ncbi:hypothetical protein NDU88_003247 [Pleurodeles waltl]|uniref:Uncharacterized protein n=1 Tax=Pleurodeles waltl TaxID=8319 RepID=A0AAV7KXX9_PLEWA|nr:hypothetical protein NDU88_003247 [Pleurodeles waltl]